MSKPAQSGWVIWLFLLVIVLFSTYLYFSEENSSPPRKKPQAVAVKVNTVKHSEFIDRIVALGTAQANEAVTITAATNDYIVDVLFDDNQLIQQGDTLVRLQNDEEQARIKELTATLEEQTRQMHRFENLAQEQAAAQSLLDEQISKVQVTKAQLKIAQTRLADLSIKAPFSGTLGLRQISPGTYVTPGTVITTLDDISKIKIAFSIPEKYFTAVAIGQSISAINQAYGDFRFTGEIFSIDPRVNATTRSIQLRALINNKNLKLRPGMLLNIQIELEKILTLLVPEKAIIPLQNKHYVFKATPDNTVTKVEVTTGRRQSGIVEILSGLAVGDQIVTEGSLRIKEGSSIRIIGD